MTGTRARDRLRDRPDMYTEARSVAGTIRVGVASPRLTSPPVTGYRVGCVGDATHSTVAVRSLSTGVTVYSRRVRDSPARAGRGAGVRRARDERRNGRVAHTRRNIRTPPGRAACLEQLFLYTVGVSVTRLMRVDPLNGFGGRSAPAAPTCGSRDVRRACAPALSVRPPHFGLYLPSAWNRK